MIHFTCANCGVGLRTKDELAGQKRKCPKCGEVAEIPLASVPAQDAEPAQSAGPARDGDDEWNGLDDVAPDQRIHGAPEQELQPARELARLLPSNVYLICDRAKLFAVWEAGGQGWMLSTTSGLIAAKRNSDRLPSQGKYTLVELDMQTTDDGKRLGGIRCHRLVDQWALPSLARGEEKILSKVLGPGSLSKEQKLAVLTFLRARFMRSIWEEATEVVDFLTNADHHSSG